MNKKIETYNTTLTTCDCPDFKYRAGGSYKFEGFACCKHQLFLLDEYAIAEEYKRSQEEIKQDIEILKAAAEEKVDDPFACFAEPSYEGCSVSEINAINEIQKQNEAGKQAASILFG